VSQAYALNDPLIVWAGRGSGTEDERRTAKDEGPATNGTGRRIQKTASANHPSSFVKVDLPNVVIETVKQAEDGQGLIVRLYECQRRRGEFILASDFPLAAAWRTNLLEENQERLEIEPYGVRYPIKPYQIVTLRLLPQ